MKNREWLSELTQIIEIIVGILTVVGIVWPQALPTPNPAPFGLSLPTPSPDQVKAFTRFLLISYSLTGAVVGGITQGKAFRELNLLHLVFSFFFRESAVGAVWGALTALLVRMAAPSRLIAYLWTFDWRSVLLVSLLGGIFVVRLGSPTTARKAVPLLILGLVLGAAVGVAIERLQA